MDAMLMPPPPQPWQAKIPACKPNMMSQIQTDGRSKEMHQQGMTMSVGGEVNQWIDTSEDLNMVSGETEFLRNGIESGIIRCDRSCQEAEKIEELRNMLSAALDAVELSRYESRVATQEAEAARRAASAADELRNLMLASECNLEEAGTTTSGPAVENNVKKDALRATSSIIPELSAERRHRLELASQLTQLQMHYDILQRKRRVDDLRLTSLTEDIAMLVATNNGIEEVLKIEHNMRVQLETELDDMRMDLKNGNKKLENESMMTQNENERLLRERDRYKNLSSTLHNEVDRLRKDLQEERRKRMSLQKKFEDVSSEDVENAVQVVEEIVNIVDETIPSRCEKNKTAKRKAENQGKPSTKSKVLPSTGEHESVMKTVIDISSDFHPPDEADQNTSKQPMEPETVKPDKKRLETADLRTKKGDFTYREPLAHKENEARITVPQAGSQFRKTTGTNSWRGGGRLVNGAVVKPYIDTIPSNLLLGPAFTIPKLK